MNTIIHWTPLQSGDFAAKVGPYALVAGEYWDRDGAWYSVFYGSEKLISDSAMNLANAQVMAENAIR